MLADQHLLSNGLLGAAPGYMPKAVALVAFTDSSHATIGRVATVGSVHAILAREERPPEGLRLRGM